MKICKTHDHCIDDALKAAESLCEKKKIRFTALRKRVLELVWQNHTPAKAYDILSLLQKEDPSAKPPTVYRALDFLLENRFIHKLYRLNAYVGCNQPENSKPCYFLICKRCSNVVEDHLASHEKLIEDVSRTHHFFPSESSFEIEGICNHCNR